MRGGGGSTAVWNFSENSSVLEEVGIPKEEGTNGPLQRYFHDLPTVLTASLATIRKHIAAVSEKLHYCVI